MPTFDAIGIGVADLERAAAFYRKLGFDFPDPIDPDGHGHAEATTRGGLRIMLDTFETLKSYDDKGTTPSGGHRMGLGFACESPKDVDETFARLTSEGAGIYKEPWDAFWGMRYAQIHDPDGNVVDLFAPLS